MQENSSKAFLKEQLAQAKAEVDNYLLQADTALKYAEQVWWSWNLPRRRMKIRSIDECILGYTPAEMEHGEEFWWDRMHPEDVAEVKQSLEECFRGKSEVWRCEHRLLDADKEWVWVEQSGFVLRRNTDHEVVEMVGTTRKTQERYQLLDLFRGSEAVIEAMAESSPICFWLRDKEGDVLLASKAMTKRFGKLTDHPVEHQICPRVGIEAWKKAFQNSFKGKCIESEIDLRQKNGQVHRNSHHLIPLLTGNEPFAVLELFLPKPT